MSRWREPLPKSSPYITPEGYAQLEKELKALWAKRRIVNDALAAAAAEGDRSENAEFYKEPQFITIIQEAIVYFIKKNINILISCTIINK